MVMGRKLAIVIAVSQSVPGKVLTGALNAARDFEEWASKQGYQTTLVTDASRPVTMPLLRQKIETLLLSPPGAPVVGAGAATSTPIFRIIVYFAGHGLIRELSEGLWLLSDWRAELRAVAVEVLKRRLSMYGPEQLCIISDACRSLPADVVQADLVPDPVLGSGPKPADLDVPIDKFFATQDGERSFMIPGANPQDDKCVFSSVLIEGLWGKTGMQKSPFSQLEPDKITGRSLKEYLCVEAALRAKSYGLTLAPACVAGFPEGADDYFRKNPGLNPPTFSNWPPAGSFGPVAGGARSPSSVAPSAPSRVDDGRDGGLQRADVDRSSPPRSPMSILRNIFSRREPPSPPPPPSPPTPEKPASIIEQLRTQELSFDLIRGYSTGVAVSGAKVARLWLGSNMQAKSLDSGGSWAIEGNGYGDEVKSGAILIEFTDGLFASSVMLRSLFSLSVRDRFGIAGTVYRDVYAPRSKAMPTEQALEALESGTLGADAVSEFATQLREFKHVDPILGVISAYLYDSVGDVDNIRRMASFYVEAGQAIPYDIALLGGLSVRQMSEHGFVVEIPAINGRAPRTAAEHDHDWTYCAVGAKSGVVAGMWPWMRQGWTYLDHPTDVGSRLIRGGLVDLRSGLMRSRFTTFEKEAGLAAAEIIGLRSRDAVENMHEGGEGELER